MRIALIALAAWPALAFAQDAPPPTPDPSPAPTFQTTAPPPTLDPSPAPTFQTTAPSPKPEAAPAAEQTAPPAGGEALRQARAFYENLHRQTGIISIAGGKVSLNVPATHYFVGAEDARRIIVDQWGNPPASAQGVDGMIFVDGANPATGAWGAIVQYMPEGHVPDEEARTTDYAKLMRDMQHSAQEENSWRRENHYPEINIVGWAEPPRYDPREHQLYWAKELTFSGVQTHTLNYDIRVLGREGYLVVSFVATMPELGIIRENAPTIMAMPTFTAGNTYADYREGVDQRASYGIAGLIAGGAAAAIAQKTGLLALIIAFGKKFIILIVAGFAAFGNAIRGMFSGRKPPDEPPPA